MTDNRRPLHILQLYPKDMNIYGDWGNTLTLKRRAQWHGYNVTVSDYNPGDTFPERIDLIVGGGGQDSGQTRIQEDLLAIGPHLVKLAEHDMPMLMICGLYQLFGRFFRTKDGQTIRGIGLLDIETHGSDQRLIGNIVTHSETFGDIIGYENHSGLTYLGNAVEPLGHLVKGAGNNGQDDTEGARYRKVIGSYLHGSLLPKNPSIADWLIEQACIRTYGDFHPTVIDDRFAERARTIASKRPR
ncbi:glutamine amidotransferase [Candidatus Saccharibacteria bacterium]|nr:MAG: glutamine amidotransferase [Candidatus Saccharibacteria bacterium]